MYHCNDCDYPTCIGCPHDYQAEEMEEDPDDLRDALMERAWDDENY